MKAINYTCFKLEEKATRSVKKNKNNFINVIGNMFAMNIRRGNLIISFCKKRFSCINYLSQRFSDVFKASAMKWVKSRLIFSYPSRHLPPIASF